MHYVDPHSIELAPRANSTAYTKHVPNQQDPYCCLNKQLQCAYYKTFQVSTSSIDFKKRRSVWPRPLPNFHPGSTFSLAHREIVTFHPNHVALIQFSRGKVMTSHSSWTE